MKDLKNALDVIEGEAECIKDYEEFCKAMDMIYELKKIFKVEEE